MVSVSSKINIYTNQIVNQKFDKQSEDKILQIEQNKSSIFQESDKYEKSISNQNNSYSNNFQVKAKNKNQDEVSRIKELTPEEKKEVEKLSKTDQKVRAHEQAHLAAGAGLVRGGASFEYTRGPDGKMYAVGGEVKIDISPVSGKPEETIRKMEKVVAAALAPVDPSPQDRAVATIARNIQTKAQIEKSEESRNKSQEKSNIYQANNEINIDNEAKTEYIDREINQKNQSNTNQRVIKQYIINNPYQKLDRILFKSI